MAVTRMYDLHPLPLVYIVRDCGLGGWRYSLWSGLDRPAPSLCLVRECGFASEAEACRAAESAVLNLKPIGD